MLLGKSQNKNQDPSDHYCSGKGLNEKRAVRILVKC